MTGDYEKKIFFISHNNIYGSLPESKTNKEISAVNQLKN